MTPEVAQAHLRQILDVCGYADIDLEKFLNGNKRGPYSKARAAVAVVLRDGYGMTWLDIGDAINRCYTSALVAYKIAHRDGATFEALTGKRQPKPETLKAWGPTRPDPLELGVYKAVTHAD